MIDFNVNEWTILHRYLNNRSRSRCYVWTAYVTYTKNDFVVLSVKLCDVNVMAKCTEDLSASLCMKFEQKNNFFSRWLMIVCECVACEKWLAPLNFEFICNVHFQFEFVYLFLLFFGEGGGGVVGFALTQHLSWCVSYKCMTIVFYWNNKKNEFEMR